MFNHQFCFEFDSGTSTGNRVACQILMMVMINNSLFKHIGSAVFFGFPTDQNTRTASIIPRIDSYLTLFEDN
jgi:hypothetical protein